MGRTPEFRDKNISLDSKLLMSRSSGYFALHYIHYCMNKIVCRHAKTVVFHFCKLTVTFYSYEGRIFA